MRQILKIVLLTLIPNITAIAFNEIGWSGSDGCDVALCENAIAKCNIACDCAEPPCPCDVCVAQQWLDCCACINMCGTRSKFGEIINRRAVEVAAYGKN